MIAELSSRDSKYTLTDAELSEFLLKFDALHPTKEDCIERLADVAEELGLLKCSCGSKNITRCYGSRKIKCLKCGKVASFTTGTIFFRMRDVRAWLFLITSLEHGIMISSSQFHRVVGGAQSSALARFKKIMTALGMLFDELAVKCESSVFVRTFRRRTTETPDRKHPREEEPVYQRTQPDQSDVRSDSDGGSSDHDVGRRAESPKKSEDDGAPHVEHELLKGLAKRLFDCLTDTPLRIDEWCRRAGVALEHAAPCIMLMVIAGLVVKFPGDCYAAKPRGLDSDHAHATEDDEYTEKWIPLAFLFSNFVRSIYSGIGRKHLQNYLTALWTALDRLRWKPRSILRACLLTPPIFNREVFAYVTPRIVRVPAVDST